MDPRRPLCADCQATAEGPEDIAEILSAVDQWSEGRHVCVVCDRTFSSRAPTTDTVVLVGALTSSGHSLT